MVYFLCYVVVHISTLWVIATEILHYAIDDDWWDKAGAVTCMNFQKFSS